MANFTSESLIPEGIKDTSTIALSKCIDEINDTDISKVLVYLLKNVDSSVLPHLAKQFHIEDIEGWAFAETDDDKIRLIENSIPMHKVKGTIPSVLKALSSLGYEVKIVKYPEYNGIPRHYKIKILETEKDLTAENQTSIIKMSDEYKQQNSVFDGFLVELSTSNTLYCSGYCKTALSVSIKNEAEGRLYDFINRVGYEQNCCYDGNKITQYKATSWNIGAIIIPVNPSTQYNLTIGELTAPEANIRCYEFVNKPVNEFNPAGTSHNGQADVTFTTASNTNYLVIGLYASGNIREYIGNIRITEV